VPVPGAGWDNGWTKTSADPWDIVTSYDYNDLGQQTRRTVTSAGGSSSRTMSWTYNPDGSLRARADDGVPVGKQVVLVDNSDFNNTDSTGTWATGDTATGLYGYNYRSHGIGLGLDNFTWKLNVPQDGSYEVFVRYPQVSGAATDAKYTINHSSGSTSKTINQASNCGTWVSLGSYSFTEGNTAKVTLTDSLNGTVTADAVKLVRDNTGDTDSEKQDFTYSYDPNGNLTTIADASPGARIDKYDITHDGLDQVSQVQEKLAGTVKNTTSFTYNENGALRTVTHDKQYTGYDYDVRDLVSKVTNGTSGTDPNPKITTFTYTDRGQRLREVKGNGNTVDYTYYLDGLLHTQTEKKPSGTLVSDHTIDYDPNGNRSHEVTKKMNADNHSAYLTTTYDYTHDPRDRISKVTKTGDGAGTESYVHDANNNVTDQTIGGTTTTFNYDRNRLLTATTGGTTAAYNYDPYGRLDTITAGGTALERNKCDGFDHITENRKTISGTTTTTKYTYDPLDRTTTKTTDVGTTKEKTTTFNYRGLSAEILTEEVAGRTTASYQYGPTGERLSQIRYNTDGTTEDGYYGYNLHSDVEQFTDSSGNTKATYGYTAYGSDDDNQFTGIDKPDTNDPTKQPYNPYRFNAKRWDQTSGNYDMGFRDYSPGRNRFLTRDAYNGALDDMNLGLDPSTSNRYAFGGGNPIGAIEIDGHKSCSSELGCLWEGFVSSIKEQFTPQHVCGRVNRSNCSENKGKSAGQVSAKDILLGLCGCIVGHRDPDRKPNRKERLKNARELGEELGYAAVGAAVGAGIAAGLARSAARGAKGIGAAGKAETAASKTAHSPGTTPRIDPEVGPGWFPPGTNKVPRGWSGPNMTKKFRANPNKPGFVWRAPKGQDSVRIDMGSPTANWPSQQVDHVVVNSDGRIIGRGVCRCHLAQEFRTFRRRRISHSASGLLGSRGMPPDSANLSTPWLRAQLAEYLGSLVDEQWLSDGLRHSAESGGEFDQMLDFFDDTGVLDEPGGRIGYILVDETEAGLMADLGRAFDKALAISAAGGRLEGSDPWRDVRVAARRALDGLLENGV
jgi:RHS repeat-associated protein